MDTHLDQGQSPTPEPTSIETRLDNLLTHLGTVQEIVLTDGDGSGLEYALPLFSAAVRHVRDAFTTLRDGNTPYSLFYASAAFTAIEGGERYFNMRSGVDSVISFRECPLAMIQGDWAGAERLASEFVYYLSGMSAADFRDLKA